MINFGALAAPPSYESATRFAEVFVKLFPLPRIIKLKLFPGFHADLFASCCTIFFSSGERCPVPLCPEDQDEGFHVTLLENNGLPETLLLLVNTGELALSCNAISNSAAVLLLSSAVN